MWVVDENTVLGPSENDDDDDADAVGSVSVGASLDSPCCCSVGDLKGSWVMAEVGSEASRSVLLWPLHECCSFSSDAGLTAPP